MFSDSPANVVGFNHLAIHKKEKTDVSCQYAGLRTEDKLCGTTDVKTTSTQSVDEQDRNENNVDWDALNRSLKKCLKILETDRNDWPTVDGHVYSNDVEATGNVNLMVSLKQQPQFGTKKISALKWNCNGDKLMVATGEHNHSQWCNHLNSIFVFSTNDLEEANCTASNKLEVTSCINCLAAHPTNEHLITAGLYNGEVFVCNTNGNMEIALLDWHTHMVIEILWFTRSDHRTVLVTAGKDGYVCVGVMVSNNIKYTQRLYRYLVGVPDKIGIQCFDYTDRHFGVALENGTMSCYMCSTGRNAKDDKVIDAVTINEYRGNSMTVECMKFCQKNSDLFVVTQFDFTILLYNIYQKNPVKTIFHSKLITRLCWCLHDENIVYVGRENGEIAKVNINKGTIVTAKKITDGNFTSIDINKRKPIIAIGTMEGNIHISSY
ncbi:uncharacterized protein LOC126844710 [Adelges cooleyi]|uniref:uncharacterized protein LOC126844710 n=1 Tax=Adelges cooleyi TaxID=133065 RepID=UPI00217F8D47|nr:uncharacterized protein LOC126844710 [Adelges cooleyi]